MIYRISALTSPAPDLTPPSPLHSGHRTPEEQPLVKPLPEYLGPNVYGYSAIFSMPCSLMAATVFRWVVRRVVQ